MRCQSCNAPLEPGAFSCSFCHAMTPEGFQRKSAEAERARLEEEEEAARLRQLEWEEQQRQAVAAQAQRSAAEKKLKSAGTGALVTGMIGFVPGCGVVFAIIAIVLGVTTRRSARRQGFEVPGGATAGLVLGVVTLFLCGGLLSLGGYLDYADKEHRKALRASVEKPMHDEQLGSNVACALTELFLLESKYQQYSSPSSEFVCSAHVAQRGTRAVLEESEIEVSGKKEKVVACLERDPTFGTWKVMEVGRELKCGAAIAGDVAE